MSSEMDPQVAQVLRGMEQIQSVVEQQAHKLNTESFKGSDEARTVGATLNGYQRLTGLYIEDGLLRLGIETVAQRVNEAIRNAQAAANAAIEADYERMMESTASITDPLSDMMGPLQLGPE